jgi:hypothetical protein
MRFASSSVFSSGLPRFSLPLLALIGVLFLAGCSAPPPLRADNYLNDQSLLTDQPCAAPCFQGITPGVTTFADAVALLQNNAAFTNVQSREKTDQNPPVVQWSTAGNQPCCQLVANPDTNIVESIFINVAPSMNLGQVIEKYGEPEYVFPADYSNEEVILGLLYPEAGHVTFVVPGNADSSIDANDPVVLVLYQAEESFTRQLELSALQGWNGFQTYQTYKAATPVITPLYTLTPAP